MRSSGNLWNHSAKASVLIHARRNDIRQKSRATHDADTGLVAGRFDSEHHRFATDAALWQGQAHNPGIDARRLVVVLAGVDVFETESQVEPLSHRVIGAHLKENLASVQSLGGRNQSNHECPTET